MLSNVLYDLCLLISTPYDKLNLISNNTSDIDAFILEEIYFRKLFDFKWRKKLNSFFKIFEFGFNYELLEENLNFIKLKLKLNMHFVVQDTPNNIFSACIREYIIILEHLHSKFKIQFLIENEDNPLLYDYILKTDLSYINNFIFCKSQNLWSNKFSSIDLLYEDFITSRLISKDNTIKSRNSSFNVSEACIYAETFALTPNPNYKSFDGIGGDCTNFISQILHAGSLRQTKAWKPYTNPWVRVEDLYVYLTTQKLGIKLPNENSLSKGCLIQFSTPIIGRFFHNGFITYELPNNDYLYCCHSYNKLNYPLSETFPNRYPILRALKMN